MHLQPGSTLEHYRIVEKIGEGGMGEVYRARDTRLDRDVALKILPALFADDAERLSRFEREAKTLASLNHPNIAQIFGIETAGAVHALAMELVDGEDLAQRLARGAVPLDDALPIAREIVNGLEAAHELGIVHRDLKPGNVKIRPDGAVKVLDFGLAKAGSPQGTGTTSDPVSAPTLTSPAATRAGIILGTAAYMAPEQARGRLVDRRADIWAFGCVLYEMLTGRRPFGGDDVSMTLAAVLKEPVDFAALPAGTPASVRRLLRRCLEKDPQKRLSAIGDARLELEEAQLEPQGPRMVREPASWRARLLWASFGAVLGGSLLIAAFLSRSPSAEPSSVVRAHVDFGTPLWMSGLRPFAIDPSGREIVAVVRSDTHGSQLLRLRLADDQPTAIPGTEGATNPIFSPDGQWLGFRQGGMFRKMPAQGGRAIEIASSVNGMGSAFLPDGVILNQAHGLGLMRAATSDSAPIAVTTVDDTKGEAGHHWPHPLPGGRHVLFTAEVDGKPYADARIMLLSLDGGERRVLIEGATDAQYVPTGHIVFWRDGGLWSVPFDLKRLQITGPAAVVVRDVMMSENTGQAYYSVADNGTLVYLAGRDPVEERSLVLVDRSGAARELTPERRAYSSVALSPDGRRIAAAIMAANDSVWVMDVDRGAPSRVTFEAENARPAWAPDGQRITFARYRGGEPPQLFIMPADGSTGPEPLRRSETEEQPESWTAAGNALAFVRRDPSGSDVWVMHVDGSLDARPVLATRFDEFDPRFSPDGGWLAYSSNESGRSEIYIRAFPGPGKKQIVSTDGGTEPRWRGDGREIYFRHGDAVLAADVMLAPDPRVSVPRVLFTDSYLPTWEAAPDGRGFIMIKDFSQPRSTVKMVQNWWAEVTSPNTSDRH